MCPSHRVSWLSELKVSSCNSSSLLTLSSTGVLKSAALSTDQVTQTFSSATTPTRISMLDRATTHWSIPSWTILPLRKTSSTELKMATTQSPTSVSELKMTTCPSATATRSCSATSKLTSRVSVYPGTSTTNSSISSRERAILLLLTWVVVCPLAENAPWTIHATCIQSFGNTILRRNSTLMMVFTPMCRSLHSQQTRTAVVFSTSRCWCRLIAHWTTPLFSAVCGFQTSSPTTPMTTRALRTKTWWRFSLATTQWLAAELHLILHYLLEIRHSWPVKATI